jgi:hypothetical protein
LPLAGNTEGPEEDNGESNDDECNDNNDNEEDGNNGYGDGIASLETHFLISRL